MIISLKATQHTTLPLRGHGRFWNAGKVFTLTNLEEKILSCLGKRELRSTVDIGNISTEQVGEGEKAEEAAWGFPPATDVSSAEAE